MSKLFPRKCECGGPMRYDRAFGRVFSYCMRCTPVSTIKASPRGVPLCLETPPSRKVKRRDHRAGGEHIKLGRNVREAT